jgi:hypothetical protein
VPEEMSSDWLLLMVSPSSFHNARIQARDLAESPRGTMRATPIVRKLSRQLSHWPG